MIRPQRDGGEPQVCYSDCQLHVLAPNCVAFTEGYVTPLVRQVHQAAAHVLPARSGFISQPAAQ